MCHFRQYFDFSFHQNTSWSHVTFTSWQSWQCPASYLRARVLWLPPHAVGHLPAACGQVEDGRGRHVGGLHVVAVVKAALAASAAGAAAPAASRTPPTAATTAQAAAAAAGSVGAGGAAGRAGVFAVAFGCGAKGEIQ